MIDELIFILTLLSALGCGLMAGFFFAFSVCVMKALSRLPPAQGVTAMQTINVVVLNRWFFAVFFGTAASCVFLGVSSLLMWQEPGALYRLIASALYLLGTMIVTIAEPNALIYLAYVGGMLLASALVTLGVGILRSPKAAIPGGA